MRRSPPSRIDSRIIKGEEEGEHQAMEEPPLKPASIATKSNALMRKNLIIQKHKILPNLQILLWPIVACLLLAFVERELTKAIKPVQECPTDIVNIFDACPYPHPAKMTTLFQIPSPTTRATRGNNTSNRNYYPDLPNGGCRTKGTCPVSILVTGANRSLAEGLGQNLFGSKFSEDDAPVKASALNIASMFILGTSTNPPSSYLLERIFVGEFDDSPLYVVQRRCKQDFSLLVTLDVDGDVLRKEVECVRGLQLWRENSRDIIRELAMGGWANQFLSAYDFSNTNQSNFNVTIWFQLTSRILRATNLASNSYLQFFKGSKVQMMLEFVKEMPNGYVKMTNPMEKENLFGLLLNFAEILVFTAVIQSLIPFLLPDIIYEKQRNLRMIMKMHGLGDTPYWIITYVYLFIVSAIYIMVLVIYGSILRLDILVLNDCGIQLVFYFVCINLQNAFILLLSTFFSDWKIASEKILKYLIIIPSFAIYKGVYLLREYAIEAKYKGSPRVGWKEIVSEKEDGILFLLLIMLVEWVLCLLLAYYFDQVGSNGSGVRKHPLWFLPFFRGWLKRSNQSQAYDVLVNMEKSDVSQEREKVDRLVRESCQGHAIICDNLKKIYPARDGNPVKHAVRGLSLALPMGECLGLLGPNGAGKTSFISMMTGLTTPSSGTAFVQGLDISEDMDIVYTRMGVCPQHDLLWEVLTGREHLLFYGRLKNLEGYALNQEVEESLKNVNLLEKGDIKVRQYSGGMKRRLSVAISLIGNPKAVYLDEPSTGLDPASKKSLWTTVQNAKKDKAIILTTHSMEEAEFLCDRVGIFVNGSLQCLGNPKELRARYGGYFLLTVTTPSAQAEEMENVVKTLSPAADKIYHISGTQKFHLPKEEVRLADIFKEVENASKTLKIQDWGLADATLEDVFIKVAQGAESIS